MRDGLAALIIEGMREDFRETTRHLSLLHHSAGKLGVDLVEIYQSLRSHASPEVASLIEGWLREGTKDIGMMGYVESVLRDGRFTYASSR